MFDLTNKIAIITGGNGTLGGAIAMGLAGQGAKIAILGRTEETINQRVEELKNHGFEAMGISADVLDQKSLEAANSQIMDRWGKIDILVNAAGGNKPGATIMPEETFFDLSMDAMDQVNQLNFKGTVLPTYIFGKNMAKNKSGSIINISSMASLQAITRVAGYSAAKAAVDNFTRWLAVEMAQKYGDGIRVNAVAPGFFVAEQNHDLLLNEDGSYTDRGNTVISNTPMARFGKPEELQGITIFLAGAASSFVTGAVFPIDGGFSAFSGV